MCVTSIQTGHVYLSCSVLPISAFRALRVILLFSEVMMINTLMYSDVMLLFCMQKKIDLLKLPLICVVLSHAKAWNVLPSLHNLYNYVRSTDGNNMLNFFKSIHHVNSL